MSGSEFTIGATVRCSDGICGELTRVVINPVAHALTHLVVEPKHRRRRGRLVPVAMVQSAAEQIQLHCTKAQFENFTEADETQFLLTAGGSLGYAPVHALTLPYYGLGLASTDGPQSPFGEGVTQSSITSPDGPPAVSYDYVPLGEVEVRRGELVEALDGAVGHVHGLVVDPKTHHVTRFLLESGHLWGAKKIAIPIRAVSGIAGSVQINLSKEEVRQLPPVDIDHYD